MYLFDLIILIDDDPINNLINKRLINKLDISPVVVAFLEAEKALDYITSSSGVEILILLDINMPIMNGWDFLDHYADLTSNRNDYLIILSSSIDNFDRQKSKTYYFVKDFIEKPLTQEKLTQSLNKKY